MEQQWGTTTTIKVDHAEEEAAWALLSDEEHQQNHELVESKMAFSRIKEKCFLHLLSALAPHPSDEPMMDDEIFFDCLDNFSTIFDCLDNFSLVHAGHAGGPPVLSPALLHTRKFPPRMPLF